MKPDPAKSASKPRSCFGVGIDFGTSNSAAALFDGKRVHLIQLEPDAPIMPSAVYIDRKFQIATGQRAIDAYIAANTGRKVELSAELLGEARTSTGQIGDAGLPEEAGSQKLYGQAFVDAGEKGRLFRGIKRLLGNPRILRLMVFDRPFRLVALVTPLLLHIKDRLKDRLQDSDQDGAETVPAILGHPVNFEGGKETENGVALGRLGEAASYARFEPHSFYPEPIAAAASYLFTHPQAHGRLILAVDFGGGTLDLCILRKQGDSFDVVATHGIGLGGDHIDQRLFRSLLFPLLGKGERWVRKGEDRQIETLFPFEAYEELLLNWAVSYRLNQNEYTAPVMQRIKQNDAAAIKFRRLYELIKRNYSYLVFQAIKETKASLSSLEKARLDIPEIDIDIELSRSRFEVLIDDLLRSFEEAVTDMLAQAGLGAESIDLVIRTGGSSLIPAVRRILESRFPGKVVEHDPFTSVAAGLAITSYQAQTSSGSRSAQSLTAGART